MRAIRSRLKMRGNISGRKLKFRKILEIKTTVSSVGQQMIA